MTDDYMLKIKGRMGNNQLGIDLSPLKTMFEELLEKNVKMQKDAHSDHMTKVIEEYLGHDYDQEDYYLNGFKTKHYLRVYEQFIREHYTTEKLMDYNYRREAEIPPSRRVFKFGSEEVSLIFKGVYFLKDKVNEDERLVVWITPISEDGALEVNFMYENHQHYSSFIERFKEYFDVNHPLRGKIIDNHWNEIQTKDVDWGDIILNPKQEKIIKRNITQFIENIKTYERNRLPTSRGILIQGPPGTGKTLLCEVIVNQTDYESAIYVSTDTINDVGDVKSVYKLARKMSPCLVIVEDIDTLGGIDRTVRGGEHPLLNEFLNCLAGVGNNDGVITLATTNYANHLDSALADRPGRFDVRLDFGLPNDEVREHILEKYLGEIKSNVDVSSFVKQTEGLSGAYLRELVMTAYMIRIEEGKKKVDKAILEEALQDIIKLKQISNPNFKGSKPRSNSNLYG